MFGYCDRSVIVRVQQCLMDSNLTFVMRQSVIVSCESCDTEETVKLSQYPKITSFEFS